MKTLSLGKKLYLLVALLLSLAVLTGTIGVIGIRKTSAGLETVYKDRVVPLKQLKAIADDYAVSVIDAVNKANAGLFSTSELLQGIDDAVRRIKKNWAEYMATTLTPEESRLAREAEALFKPADAAVQRLRQHVSTQPGTLKGTLGEYDGPLYADIDPISSKITELVDLQLSVAQKEYHAARTRYVVITRLSVGSLVFGVLFGAGIGVAMARGASRSISRIAETLSLGATETTGAATQVAAASQTLAEGASQQAASLEETSSSLEELSSMTKRNGENTQSAKVLANQTRQAAETGASDMSEMTQAMDDIKASSDNIARIIKTIDEIAFQTNILALNAAVEAARAGETGMGFAVVADEVRNLAQRSAQAARETAALIEDSIQKSERGVVVSSRIVLSLQAIVEKARRVDELVAEVASASSEQTQGIAQINTAVAQMDKVTQGNAATAEESASAAEELNAQAHSIEESVEQLLRIVGRSSSLSQGAPAAAPAKSPPARHAQAPQSGNAGAHRAGSLVASPAMSQTISKAPLRSEIALESNFKEF